MIVSEYLMEQEPSMMSSQMMISSSGMVQQDNGDGGGGSEDGGGNGNDNISSNNRGSSSSLIKLPDKPSYNLGGREESYPGDCFDGKDDDYEEEQLRLRLQQQQRKLIEQQQLIEKQQQQLKEQQEQQEKQLQQQQQEQHQQEQAATATTKRRRRKKLEWNKGIRGKLYDRSYQEEELLNAFIRRTTTTTAASPTTTDTPQKELVLITGPAGVGKTTLVTSCLWSIVVEHEKGYFVSGKFDAVQSSQNQNQQNNYSCDVQENYVPFIQAFTQWTNQVKDRGDKVMKEMKRRIETQIPAAESIQVLIDVIPALEQVLGIVPQQPQQQQQQQQDTTTQYHNHHQHHPLDSSGGSGWYGVGNNSNVERIGSQAERVPYGSQAERIGSHAERAAFGSHVMSSHCELLGGDGTNGTVGPIKGGNVQQNFIYLFCQFVQAICTPITTTKSTSSSKKKQQSTSSSSSTSTTSSSSSSSPPPPVVLFLDDLQWAEPASLALLAALVQVSNRIPGFFVVGACRGNEVSPHDPLSATLRSLEGSPGNGNGGNGGGGVLITTIIVDNMSPEGIHEMVCDMLEIELNEQDQSLPLADFIYRQTHGNTFFSLQLLRRLIEEGFLFRDTGTNTNTNSRTNSGSTVKEDDDEDNKEMDQNHHPHHQQQQGESGEVVHGDDESMVHTVSSLWKWKSEDTILQSIACGDVVHMVAETIRSFPPEQQHVLMVGACLGADFDEYTLHEVCQDACAIANALSNAEEKGLLGSAGENHNGLLVTLPSSGCSVSTSDGPSSQFTNTTDGPSSHFSTINSNNTTATPPITNTPSMVDTSCWGGMHQQTWRFTHDMIHQCAYSLIDERQRAEFHLNIGRRLWASATASGIDDSMALNIFVIVNQLKRGMELMTDEEERYRMAVLCLQAGEKSIMGSGFQVAASYMNLAVDLLGERHWRDQYHLSLDLFNAAAEVEYCNGNFARMDYCLEEVLNNARHFHDKLRAYTTKVYSLGTRGDMQGAINIGLDVLKGLGEPFPKRKPGIIRILLDFAKTKRMLGKFRRDEDILNLHMMVDIDKLAATRMLHLLFHYALNCRPELAALIGFRNIQIALKHGLSSMSSCAFAGYAMLLCNGFGDVDNGCRYAELGVEMYHRFEAREWTARTYCAAYGFCFGWKRPLRDLLQPLLEGHQTGLATGDIEFSLLCATVYSGLGFYSNRPLDRLSVEMISFFNVMQSHQQESQLLFMAPLLQLVKNLMGSSDQRYDYDGTGNGNDKHPAILKGEFCDLDNLLKLAAEQKNDIIIAWCHFLNMLSNAIFNNFSKSNEAAAALDKSNTDAFPPHNTAYWMLYKGIGVLSAQSTSSKSLQVGKECIKRLKTLAKHSPSSYSQFVNLLEGEYLSSIHHRKPRLHAALSKYNEAALEARSSGFLCVEALAYERSASVHERLDRMEEARGGLRKAQLTYHAWGAHAKADQIVQLLSAKGVGSLKTP